MEDTDSKSNPHKKSKVADRRWVPIGSPSWLSNMSHHTTACNKIASKIAAEAINNNTKPFGTELFWTPGIVLNQNQIDNNSVWPYFDLRDPANPTRVPPAHVRLSDWWVAAVITNEDITARKRGKVWTFDFDANGLIKTTRVPRGEPVIVELNGDLFLPVVKQFYVLCGQEMALRIPWVINFPPKKTLYLWTNMFRMPKEYCNLAPENAIKANFPGQRLKCYTYQGLLSYELPTKKVLVLQADNPATLPSDFADDSISLSTKGDFAKNDQKPNHSPSLDPVPLQSALQEETTTDNTKPTDQKGPMPDNQDTIASQSADQNKTQAAGSSETPLNPAGNTSSADEILQSVLTSFNYTDPRVAILQEQVAKLKSDLHFMRIDNDSSLSAITGLNVDIGTIKSELKLTKTELNIAKNELDIALESKLGAIEERDQARSIAEGTSNKLDDALSLVNELNAKLRSKDDEIEKLRLQLFEARSDKPAEQSDLNRKSPLIPTNAAVSQRTSSILKVDTSIRASPTDMSDNEKIIIWTHDANRLANEMCFLRTRLTSLQDLYKKSVDINKFYQKHITDLDAKYAEATVRLKKLEGPIEERLDIIETTLRQRVDVVETDLHRTQEQLDGFKNNLTKLQNEIEFTDENEGPDAGCNDGGAGGAV
ncbi:hypothetical protein P170DRAFT_498641 [Aspergillus steynii IBT 23096]|uniref:Uncharacterized protein n=1 Tax=Aspergillus steynii IBT 23096 TaxID=1392250 RepID=A0A2I2G1C8_9EURO|nr:uncharacterized protein P170DRAFT_498641 [Aspergillus steynii IBT 23096]PLB46685.1 hypothetical protein P170DRAFT_498641 [Aspergillus steynii IBT 23096]